MEVGSILGRLTPYRNQYSKLVDEQSTGDIINAITTAHKIYKPEYKKISSFFNEGSPRATGKKIYNFLKNHVAYTIEPSEKQTVKSPSAILAQGHGDCKHYSLFAGGILDALKIPFAYRFASYKTFDQTPGHVFVVINPGSEKEIWLDPVLNDFDYKKPYTYAKDKKMAVYSISGVGATKAQKAAVKAAKTAKKAAPKGTAKKEAQQAVQAAKKAAGTTLGQKLKKGAKVVLKVAASPVRNAFLLLVKINFANLAVKLNAAYEKSPTKVREFWESAGGQIAALKKQFDIGKSKKRILGIDCGMGCPGCDKCQAEIGVAPAAAATAAAPLIVKAGELLKSLGIDPAELVQIGKDAINQKTQELVKSALSKDVQEEATDVAVAQQATGEDLAPAPTNEQAEISPTTVESLKSTSTTTAGSNINKILPWVAAGAVIYFVTKKK